MNGIIAQRELDFFDGGDSHIGNVIVHLPVDEGDCWRCDYQIAWPGFERSSRVFGQDSWQALVLAMRIVPTEISVTQDFKYGRIGVFGEALNEGNVVEVFGTKGFDA